MTMAQTTIVLQHLRRLSGKRAAVPADAKLLQRFQASADEAAFADLVRRHGPMVLGVCRSVLRHQQDAEDAFQATFLVLARKAGSIRRAEALAAFLHEVAYRVALKAKAGIERRRARERKAIQAMDVDPTLDLTVRELRCVVHEELRRLPEQYRLPLVLCYLEGLSQEEAARQLGWSKDTLRGRLNRAREFLRRRLQRRGLTMGALGAAELFLPAPAAPAALNDALVQTVLDSTANGVSTQAAALAESLTGSLAWKARLLGVVVLAVCLCAGAAAVATKAIEAPFADPPKILALAPRVADGDSDAVVCRGRILDPEGKPVKGAAMRLIYANDCPDSGKVWATSAADGSFRFAIPGVPFGAGWRDYPWNFWNHATLMAAAEGHGFAVARVDRSEMAAGVTLRLARNDIAIRGRILDLEGKPLSGVRVRLDNQVLLPRTGDLTAWLTALRTGSGNPDADHLESYWGGALGLLIAPVTTDADGRFEIKGIGRERVARLRIDGPTIATERLQAMTRLGEGVRTAGARRGEGRTTDCYGAAFEHVAWPTRPVGGTLRDRDTGKPLAGVTVHGHLIGITGTQEWDLVRTTTDEEGKYRLLGLPKGRHGAITVDAEDLPYFPGGALIGSAPGLEAVNVDISLKRGVWVRGRVTEKQTGKAVRARVKYLCFQDNPILREVVLPELPLVMAPNCQTETDGSYRIVALPGAGVIGVFAHHDRYVRGGLNAAVQFAEPRRLGFSLRTVPQMCNTCNFHALVEIAPRPGAAAVACDVVLDTGRTLEGVILGPDEKPLAGARMSGFADLPYWNPTPLSGADFTVEGITTSRPRVLQFVHEARRLAGSAVLRGDEKGPIYVRLNPWGALGGRVLTTDGQPLGGIEISSSWDRAAVRGGSLPLPARADKDGRFRVEGLAPGLAYSLDFTHGFYPLSIATGKTKDLKVQPGKTAELGEIRVVPAEQ
jgi:RNA polymerase sigma factor (sigma-70 family)